MENSTCQYTNETLPCYQKRMDVNEKSILKLPLTMNEKRETASSRDMCYLTKTRLSGLTQW